MGGLKTNISLRPSYRNIQGSPPDRISKMPVFGFSSDPPRRAVLKWFAFPYNERIDARAMGRFLDKLSSLCAEFNIQILFGFFSAAGYAAGRLPIDRW